MCSYWWLSAGFSIISLNYLLTAAKYNPAGSHSCIPKSPEQSCSPLSGSLLSSHPSRDHSRWPQPHRENRQQRTGGNECNESGFLQIFFKGKRERGGEEEKHCVIARSTLCFYAWKTVWLKSWKRSLTMVGVKIFQQHTLHSKVLSTTTTMRCQNTCQLSAYKPACVNNYLLKQDISSDSRH